MKTVNLKTILILTFQLAIILVLVSSGTMNIRKMASHSAITIKDNLRSVRYCSEMRNILYSLKTNPEQLSLRINFEKTLQSEFDNITIPGEGLLANTIKDEYFNWIKYPEDSIFNKLLVSIDAINELNINAIEKRNDEAQQSASNANTKIILIGFFGGLLAFIFTFAFIGQLIIQKTNSETP
ncbi:MAG: hypothetical protein ABI723_22550 [Bacteroidia bacterium]